MGIIETFPFLLDPNICYILLVVGFYAVLFELTHPGFVFFGIMGVGLLVLDYFLMLDLAVNLSGLFLICGGVGLFILEAFFPRLGLIAVLGVAAMVTGSAALFPIHSGAGQISWGLVFPLAIMTALITVFLVRSSIRAFRRRGIAGKEGMVGLKGEAYSDLGPGKKGKVSAQGTLWNAFAEEPIVKGERVEIISFNNMELNVKKAGGV